MKFFSHPTILLPIQDQSLPKSLAGLHHMAEASRHFWEKDVSPRLQEKEFVTRGFRDVKQKLKEYEETSNFESYLQRLEEDWNQLMILLNERDQVVQGEITRWTLSFANCESE